MSAPTPSLSVVTPDGKVRSLIRTREPDVHVTTKEIAEPSWLARFLTRLYRSVSNQEQVFRPRRVDFEDVVVDATNAVEFRFSHNFNGRVRWWVVQQNGFAKLRESPSTDNNTLVLKSGTVCKVTVRIEEAG